jgi:hypothetical protein
MGANVRRIFVTAKSFQKLFPLQLHLPFIKKYTGAWIIQNNFLTFAPF